MKKNMYWVALLAVLLIIAFATNWGIIIKVAVILNALIVLCNVIIVLYKTYCKKENGNGK